MGSQRSDTVSPILISVQVVAVTTDTDSPPGQAANTSAPANVNEHDNLTPSAVTSSL